MITKSTFKILYFTVFAILALVAYFLDQDRGKFFKRQRDGIEEDDEDKKTDVRQVVSNVLVILVFFGLFGAIFVLSDDSAPADPEGLTQIILR